MTLAMLTKCWRILKAPCPWQTFTTVLMPLFFLSSSLGLPTPVVLVTWGPHWTAGHCPSLRRAVPLDITGWTSTIYLSSHFSSYFSVALVMRLGLTLAACIILRLVMRGLLVILVILMMDMHTLLWYWINSIFFWYGTYLARWLWVPDNTCIWCRGSLQAGELLQQP